ncbi:MAG: hypothetical protein WAW36_01075 [Methylovulum miyakonense]|uniref:hypothetical protein n=1 Tax=Methylovulum miyakonense TaxID=645578 RepID=UPI003BB48F5B
MGNLRHDGIKKKHGIEVGGLQNRILLALRALHSHADTATSAEIHDWLPSHESNGISAALALLEAKGMVSKQHEKGHGRGRHFVYALTDQGAGLVHPKSGPLSYRQIAAGNLPYPGA